MRTITIMPSKVFLLFFLLWWGLFLKAEQPFLKEVRFFYPSTDSLKIYSLHYVSDFAVSGESPDEDKQIHFEITYEITGEDQTVKGRESIQKTAYEDKYIETQKGFKLLPGAYTVKMQITDINNSSSKTEIFNIIKPLGFHASYILPLNGETGEIIYQQYTHCEDIELYAPVFAEKKMTLLYFENIGHISLPPFNGINNRVNFSLPDKKESITFNESGIKTIKSFQKGVYVVLDDSSSLQESFALTRTQKDFPEIKTVKEIVEPMRYLCMTTEYDKMIEAKTSLNQRSSFENLWLEFSKNSKPKAKNLIKVYFNRVLFTNTHFTSYKEGWKTDRGMIFIIFGAPDHEKITDDKIIWTYGNKGSLNTLNFTFEKVKNSVSKNDYVLNRDPDYKNPWYISVESWRSGDIYKLN